MWHASIQKQSCWVNNLQTLKYPVNPVESYFGTSGALGAAGTSLGGAGVSVFAGCSITTLFVTLVGTVCCAYNQASPRLERKKTVPRIAVLRVRKLAEPRLPNKVCEAPLPKDAPMSAPLPCCNRIRPISATADMT